MSMTYLDIVNEVLRDVNEVPLSITSFAQARGFHAFVKGAVNRSLMDLANASDEWPWLANLPSNIGVSAHTNEIVTKRRQVIYQFPDEVREVDWDSFVVTDMRGKESIPLTPISYEEWQRYRHADVLSNREEADLGTPTVVYRTKDGQGFGLSKVPDKAYRVQYIAWREPTILSAPTDTLPFPDRYYTVLVHRARYYAWMFRENPQQAQMAFRDYEAGVSRMRQSLIKPIFQRMRAV
ncbi:tail protein [Aeromonas phage 1233]|nr:tail protein [Aeromonas phage 1233]